MAHEVIVKKLEQIGELLNELERLLSVPDAEFEKNLVTVRAAERNFQLVVDLASDINTQMLLERGKPTPDTYRQSFIALGRERVIEATLAKQLSASAGLRNILVHEYDFEEDYQKFYEAAKHFLPRYREYLKQVMLHTEKEK